MCHFNWYDLDMEAPRFEPSVLVWAREKRGISIEIVASKLSESFKDISVNLVAAWEKGTDYPHPSHVKKLAEIYKRPTAVFLLPHPPEENPLPPDRRTFWKKTNEPFSPEALLVIRRARRIQELAAELEEELGQSKNFEYPRHDIDEDPALLATKMRKDLDISLTAQIKAKTYAEFFAYIRQRIEGTGVITLKSGGHNSFPSEEARAFSFTDKQPYVILVNNKDTEGAKNFSLLHEFAHILVRDAGICDNFTSFNGKNGTIDPLEVFCNRFAAAFLVPETDFLGHRLLNGRREVFLSELEPIVKTLVTNFKVSRFVILRRLLTFNLITTETYKGKAKEWENEKPPIRKGGRSLPAQAALLTNGISYSSLVFEAYKHEKLSYATASDYLGVKPKHLPAIEKNLRSYGRRSLV
jgi:Zn-dependent peptidase ImmA (M78 family)